MTYRLSRFHEKTDNTEMKLCCARKDGRGDLKRSFTFLTTLILLIIYLNLSKYMKAVTEEINVTFLVS